MDDSAVETGIPMIAVRAVRPAVCAVALYAVAAAVASPDLEWRVLAMVALAFAAGPLIAQMKARGEEMSVGAPLAHPVLLASALALGPPVAALPGAASGIARLMLGPPRQCSLLHALYAVLKPALACVAAGLAYSAAGGSVIKPQEVESFAPLLAASCCYIAANALLVEAGGAEGGGPHDLSQARSRVWALAAGWCMCVLAGYVLAVLYAFAPSYVLLAPTLAAAVSVIALRGGAEQPVTGCAMAESVEPDESSAKPSDFTDPATGLANMRYLRMFLDREISRSQRKGGVLSVATFELDGAGRLAGTAELDDAVAAVGRQLRSGLRDYDLIARHSAGRLIVVLPDTTAEGAYEVTHRLHESLVQMHQRPSHIRVAGGPASVTAGIASFPDHGHNTDELINSSHHALNLGRYAAPNRVYGCHNLPKAS